MWERIRVILRKEFIQMLRNPRMRGMLFLAPLIQLVMFGYAVTLDVDHARIAWRDMSHTPESRALRARFEGSGRFDVVALAESEEDVQRLLDRSEVHAVVAVLPGFARDLARGKNGASAGLAGWDELQHGFARLRLCRRSHRRVRPGCFAQPLKEPTDDPGNASEQLRQTRHGAGRLQHARLVQSGSAKPQFFHSGGYGKSSADADADVDCPGDHPGERNRHDGAADGHAYAAHRTDAREDAAFCAGRVNQHDDRDGCGAVALSDPFSRQFFSPDILLSSVSDAQPGSRYVPFNNFKYAAAGKYGLVFYHNARVHVERFCFPHQQHAAVRAIPHLP